MTADDAVALRLGPGDAGELLTLHRAAFVSEAILHDDLTLPPLRRTLDEVAAGLADDRAVTLGLRVATGRPQAGRLVGTVRLDLPGQADGAGGEEAELGRLAVVPDLQGRGLGSRLLALAEAAAPAGLRRIRLFTGERSVANLRLYRRHGYVETHRTPWAGYALVHMVKELPATR